MQRHIDLFALTRDRMRTRHLALRTEHAYLQWLRRYLEFHKGAHPSELGAREVEEFLTHLAVHRKVSAATQSQALQALLFLYRHVLGIELPWLDNVTRAAQPKRLPVVLSRAEVAALLAQLSGTPWLVASLLYGSGLRLTEGLRLRVKDLALERGELVVREAKGGKDRVTMLPAALDAHVRAHLARLRSWYEEERRRQRPGVSLPRALGRKFPDAAIRWGWQYLFPAATAVPRPVQRPAGAASPAREDHPARRPGRGSESAAHSTRELPHPETQLRDPSARGRLRHPHGAGAARPLGLENHHDLHPRHGKGRGWRSQPPRPAKRRAAGHASLRRSLSI